MAPPAYIFVSCSSAQYCVCDIRVAAETPAYLIPFDCCIAFYCAYIFSIVLVNKLRVLLLCKFLYTYV